MTRLAERPASPRSRPDPGTRAVIYTRISEDRYGEAEGVERQRAACEKLAASRGVEVIGYFEDNDRSAMHGARPAYAAMLDAVRRAEVDVILVLRTDRLYRQLRELVELTTVLGNVPVYCVKSGDVDLSSADGRLRANIMGAVAQHESEVKGERVADAAEQRATKGRFNGGQRRFGYEHSDTRTVFLHKGGQTREIQRPTGPLRLVPDEADAIGWAYRHILQGGTLEAVVREWRERGLTGPQGARFTGVAVRDVLLRPMNAGLASFKGSILGPSAELPAIVDAETWHGVRAILTDPARRTTVGRPAVSLLAPVLRCAVCLADPNIGGTARMSAKYRERRNGTTRDPVYTCREAGHVSRIRPKLDAAVEELMVAYLVRNAAALRRPVTGAPDGVAAVLREAEKLRDRLAGYHARAAEMDPADYSSATKAVRAKLSEVEKRIMLTSGNPATAALVRADDIPIAWAGMSTDAKRAVINENVERIEIGHGISGARDRTMHNVRVFDVHGREIEPAR